MKLNWRDNRVQFNYGLVHSKTCQELSVCLSVCLCVCVRLCVNQRFSIITANRKDL